MSGNTLRLNFKRYRPLFVSGSAAIALASLSACTIDPALLMDRSGPGIAGLGSVTLVGADDTSTQALFRTALERNFAALGMAASEGGDLVVDYSISARPAEIGVAQSPTGGAPYTTIDYISAPSQDKFLQECGPQRLRATIVIFDKAKGALQYRGVREINLCDVTATSVENMAAELVADAQKS